MEKLKQKCSKYFTYEDLIICGETVKTNNIANQPIQNESWDCLADLARSILDPVYEEYGEMELTYGFCSHLLSKIIKRNIYPSLDQHSSMEKNSKGKRICNRGGAAVDFRIGKISSLRVAKWIAARLPFDRLYFYGNDLPIHVSYHRSPKKAIVLMKVSENTGRKFPQNIDLYRFMDY